MRNIFTGRSHFVMWLAMILLINSQNIIHLRTDSLTEAPDYLGDDQNWPMAGANPERTSWTLEEVRGDLKPVWFKIFEPYILPRVQVIASNNLLFISTANGLYALDAETGREEWVFSTEMPLGHSPTIDNGVVYVGGYDHHIYALDAFTGKSLWTFKAEGGFDTNPLVVQGKVYVGSRDGFFYAVNASGPDIGKMAWKYPTGGQIHFSAAYKDGLVYFASDDSHAYALHAGSGRLVWKSEKLPGAGFRSWWPVIYEDYVIFAGSNNYRNGSAFGANALVNLDEEYVFPNRKKDPRGTLIGLMGQADGNWVEGTVTIDTSKANVTQNGSTKPVTQYFEDMPWRRTYFVLDRATGKEYTSDFDKDGKPEYAPFLWFGTYTGNRYPPLVGNDGVLYQPNTYMSDPAIAGGQITGWMPGTPYISMITSSWNAVDEPVAYSGGGDLIYWNRCCDRVGGSIDISVPYQPEQKQNERIGSYFSYDLQVRLPGYNASYYTPNASFGGRTGVYGIHGDVNPPVPYAGKVYMIRSNALIAFGNTVENHKVLSPAKIVIPSELPVLKNKNQVAALLELEVRKMIEAGHLKPGYLNTGLFDMRARINCGDDLTDYWHTPGDLITTIIRAMPYLSPALREEAKGYIQSEFEDYPPYLFTHIGWKDGTAREDYILPPEIEAGMEKLRPKNRAGFSGWSFNPTNFYALWKYAEVFGDAKEIFDASKGLMNKLPPDSLLLEMPHVHNAYIAGYTGYLGLEKLAGYPESRQIRAELSRILQLRADRFSTEPPPSYFNEASRLYCRTLNVSRNFMYLVPELAEYLQDHALAKVEAAILEYEQVAPLWFVARSETTFGEGVTAPLYDYHSLFQAKAQILNEPYEELEKYLDVPGVPVGDLFYIQNLTALLEACSDNLSSSYCN